MRQATFLNFTNKPFTAYWNGREYTFKPGQKKTGLNESIAAHFAKHLANKVLTEAGKEQHCSPKKPEQNTAFMDIYNKAFFMENDGMDFDPETGLPTGEGEMEKDEVGMNIRTVPRQKIGAPAIPKTDLYDANAQPKAGPGDKPQIIGEATEGDEDEEEFEGK